MEGKLRNWRHGGRILGVVFFWDSYVCDWRGVFVSIAARGAATIFLTFRRLVFNIYKQFCFICLWMCGFLRRQCVPMASKNILRRVVCWTSAFPADIGVIKLIPNVEISIEIEQMTGFNILQISRVIWKYFTNVNLLFSWLELSTFLVWWYTCERMYNCEFEVTWSKLTIVFEKWGHNHKTMTKNR